MSADALWIIRFADATATEWVNGGVVILETGRLYGGDGSYYYLGTFERKEGRIFADIRVVHHSGIPSATFGAFESDFRVRLEARLDGATIDGELWRLNDPDQRLPVRLDRKADLP